MYRHKDIDINIFNSPPQKENYLSLICCGTSKGYQYPTDDSEPLIPQMRVGSAKFMMYKICMRIPKIRLLFEYGGYKSKVRDITFCDRLVIEKSTTPLRLGVGWNFT